MWKLKGPGKFDYLLFICVIASCVIGMLVIFSTSSVASSMFIYKQFVAFLLGLAGILLLSYIDYRHLRKYAPLIYGFCIGLLVLVLLVGKVTRGSRSWFSLGYFSFQPSEFISLALILILARYIEAQQKWEPKQLFICLLYTLIPVGLILLQPDFGSSLVFIPIFLGMVYLGGMRLGYIISLILAGCIAVFISLFLTFAQLNYAVSGFSKLGFVITNIFSNMKQAFSFLLLFYVLLVLFYFLIRKINRYFSFRNVWYIFLTTVLGVFASFGIQHFLKDYQRQRLIAFLNPDFDPLGMGYNIIQSRIAIGSGRFLGKGIMSGTQSKLGFLPEQHTDFIFAVIGEELGFIGAGLLLFLLCIILYRGILISNQSRDTFGNLVSAGIVCMIAFHAILNIGMVIGIMPVVGVPLPFVSYGGSSLLAHMLGIGILLGVYYRRFMY